MVGGRKMSQCRNCCGKLVPFCGTTNGYLSLVWEMVSGVGGSEVVQEADPVHWAHPGVGSACEKLEQLAI